MTRRRFRQPSLTENLSEVTLLYNDDDTGAPPGRARRFRGSGSGYGSLSDSDWETDAVTPGQPGTRVSAGSPSHQSRR